MDPTARCLLSVQIDDPIEADHVFTMLMGDEVKPPREFIETNALRAAMLMLRGNSASYVAESSCMCSKEIWSWMKSARQANIFPLVAPKSFRKKGISFF